jgi:hypothetical protein
MFATPPSRRSRRGASRPIVHVLGLALVLVACGDDGDGAAPPPSTLPPSIAACADAAVGEPAERCLDAIQSALEADTTAWADGRPVAHTAFLWAVNP